jgi:MFS transporter, DHA1 family, inner membrane transport protein
MQKEKIIVGVLSFLNFTHIIDFMILMPLSPQLMRVFGISPQQFSYAVGAYTISAGIVGFLSAFIVDKLDRKKVLLVGYIGFILGTLGCALAWSYWALVGFRILAGGFGGLITTQVNSIVADLVPYEKRGEAMGILSMGFSMASVLGVPLGLLLANTWNWQVAFGFIVVLSSIGLPLAIIIIPKMKGHLLPKNTENREKNTEKPSPFIIITQIIQEPIQYLGILFMLSTILGHFLIIPFFSPYMVANVGFTEDQLTYIYVIGGLLTFITSPYVGKFADKYGKFMVLYYALIGSSLSVLLMTNFPKMPFYYALPFTGIFFIFASARHIPANAIVSNLVSPAQRGSYLSVSASMQQLAMGGASLLAGLMITKNPNGSLSGYHYVGIIAICFTALALFLGRILEKKQGELA